MEPGQNVMIAHMTTQVEMGMKELKKRQKSQSKPRLVGASTKNWLGFTEMIW